ncbi:hypothetical protein GCM10008025_08720 [Ornithinibacillus halotolerans]|uniref:Uncharacterized protein n=1 Tax=Ornithinibacillus halotolerans TaxID=1274357 RepID=A0A916RSN9_9BACI|nr:hypothetical protein GCM10008025_08720 [Ornithinibacillus halotolerans]
MILEGGVEFGILVFPLYHSLSIKGIAVMRSITTIPTIKK